MSDDILKEARILAPTTDGTNNSNMLLLSMGVTHAAMAFPAGWEQRWVTIQVFGTSGKSGWFLVSESSTAEVDRTIVATAAGAGSTKLGKRIQVGEVASFQLPNKGSTDTLYLINETDDATTTAEIWLSSPS
jgi:hypothetical protein